MEPYLVDSFKETWTSFNVGNHPLCCFGKIDQPMKIRLQGGGGGVSFDVGSHPLRCGLYFEILNV